MDKGATPHKCPVCSGTGLVPNGFYSHIGSFGYSTSSITPENCRSCDGGVIWNCNFATPKEIIAHE